MSDVSIADINFLFFVIPGFIAVWSYRYSTYSEKKADFEYLGLSFFWGLVIAALSTLLLKNSSLFNNPYAVSLTFSIIGLAGAFTVSVIKEKNRLTATARAIKLFMFSIWKKMSKAR